MIHAFPTSLCSFRRNRRNYHRGPRPAVFIKVSCVIDYIGLREINEEGNYRVVDCPEPGKVRYSKDGFDPVTFAVDHTFYTSADGGSGDQQEVYKSLGVPLLTKALAGYNACLFAYGVTSSGKTYR